MKSHYGINEVSTLMGDIAKDIQQSINTGLGQLASEIDIPTEGLGVYKGTYKESWKVTPKENSVIIESTAPHASAVEYGRRPGAAIGGAMIEALTAWVRAKVKSGSDAKSIAWAIAFAIRARGLWQPAGLRLVEKARGIIAERAALNIAKLVDRGGT